MVQHFVAAESPDWSAGNSTRHVECSPSPWVSFHTEKWFRSHRPPPATGASWQQPVAPDWKSSGAVMCVNSSKVAAVVDESLAREGRECRRDQGKASLSLFVLFPCSQSRRVVKKRQLQRPSTQFSLAHSRVFVFFCGF